MRAQERVVAVVIGRNEGARLVACLESLQGELAQIVYVDSGSTDGSVEAARACGAGVVTLDLDTSFTAARARNAGAQAVPEADYLQFVDGDCTIVPGWVASAQATLAADPTLAVVCGRRREVAPEASVWNRLIDREWDTPIGEARACGGDALIRRAAFDAVGGFDPGIIAGEEPELCVRLRAHGWRILRIDAEMTRHDAGLTHIGQWWTRARRAGYAYALGAARHGAAPERHCVPQLIRALLWGGVLPAAALALALAGSIWALAPLALYLAQILRIWRRDGDAAHAAAITVSKIAEASGVLRYALDRLTGRAGRIIEYK